MSLQRRTPLRSGAAPSRRARLRPVSASRQDERWEWEQVKNQVADRDRGQCQAERARWLYPEHADQIPPCAGRLDPHHIHPTGEGGERLDPLNVCLLCRHHHRWVHSINRALATTLGLISRNR